MKPERIEELARLAYEAPALGKIYTPYEHASRTIKEYHRKLARTLYAAAMRDAAGVAREFSWSADIQWWIDATKKDVSAETCVQLATALETIGKETDSAGSRTI
jgi:hypothetical protein